MKFLSEFDWFDAIFVFGILLPVAICLWRIALGYSI